MEWMERVENWDEIHHEERHETVAQLIRTGDDARKVMELACADAIAVWGCGYESGYWEVTYNLVCKWDQVAEDADVGAMLFGCEQELKEAIERCVDPGIKEQGYRALMWLKAVDRAHTRCVENPRFFAREDAKKAELQGGAQ